jgi:lycopene cyclase domain-containing protein
MMSSRYLYLLINLLSVIIPFMLSFYPRAPFFKKWKYFAFSTLITTCLFVIWDAIFTHIGVWGFNPKYILGIYVIGLPIEEILFFICIPYSCVFTYEAINHFIKTDKFKISQHWITRTLIILLFAFGLVYINHLYTSVTFIALALFLVFLEFKVKPLYMGKFYFMYLIILIPFFIVNGVLTGSFIEDEVVWYNNFENLGIRMGTIPFEDTFYGMLMILMNISIFEWLQSVDKKVKLSL